MFGCTEADGPHLNPKGAETQLWTARNGEEPMRKQGKGAISDLASYTKSYGGERVSIAIQRKMPDKLVNKRNKGREATGKPDANHDTWA